MGLVVAGVAGCNYSLRGGSFPGHIRTVAVLPFENETTRLELTQELFDIMSRELPRALGVRVAGEEVADAVVRGRITLYNLGTPSYRAAAGGERAEVLQRQVTIGIAVEIVDLVERVILWDNSALRGEGQYAEQTQTEEDGMLVALDLLVQRIVDGAQSNW
ncbi:MAG TPA: LPS assembly lipoprotein LptE [Longimicrobiales bacterium]|jgi:hypothetical protein